MPSIARSPRQAGYTLHLSEQVGSGIKAATIFVVDHDAAVRDALSVTLRSSGFGVRTFGSAGDLLDTLPVTQEGCLLIEFDLQDMTGTDLIVRLHRERIALPAVIMSARLRLPVFERPYPSAITAILQKPFGQDELLQCLRRALGDR
ncbi:MAG: response regulator [Alphaproteobacteria bacterium]|nr:response regulator [Alphaproteobacteria bacterium]